MRTDQVEEADEGPSPLDLVAELEGKKVEEADEGPSPLDLVSELEGRTIEDARPVFPELPEAEPHAAPDPELKAVLESLARGVATATRPPVLGKVS